MLHSTVLHCKSVFFSVKYFSARAGSPELQYPSLKFEDVGGNEESLMVSVLPFAKFLFELLMYTSPYHCL